MLMEAELEEEEEKKALEAGPMHISPTTANVKDVSS
jgi:hypothetical protein